MRDEMMLRDACPHMHRKPYCTLLFFSTDNCGLPILCYLQSLTPPTSSSYSLSI